MPSRPGPDDLAIARRVRLRPIAEVAAAAGIARAHLVPYGRDVAKVELAALDGPTSGPAGRLVVVTAITPTPAGEGKTATAVGLAQALRQLGHRATLTLRQPSMGPTFGIKGGAAGAGHSQVLPMETLNLHLTGDFHAVTAAHNLLAAMVDNHLHHGNPLGLDPRDIAWRRVLDVNDRALRHVVVGLGEHADGVTRQSGFDITAASEVMVILALATSVADLRARLGRIVVGYTYAGRPVTAEDLHAAGAMAVLLRDALLPNLLQTSEHGPALVHTGPFGNIATGNSSVIADLLAARTADYVVTEAGFGADMGLERLVNVKCRVSGQRPAAAVVVVTARALKMHAGRWPVRGGAARPDGPPAPDPAGVLAGAENLRAQLRIVRRFGLTPVVAVNAFPDDHPTEHEVIRGVAEDLGVAVAVATHVADGGAGARDLAELVVAAADGPVPALRPSYQLDAPLRDKIEALATDVYGAAGVDYSPRARSDLQRFEVLGYGGLPVVVAKTHLSISADPTRRGAPTGWRLPVREVRAAAGAGYLYAVCGDMRTMPGLSRTPAATSIDLDPAGRIVGLS
ncbi:MAG: formate--tetrahydrofolate ligase [Dermatophilaceae bacterium]